MAVGPGSRFPLPPIAGVRLASTSARIRTASAPNLVLLELAPGGKTAAVFTRNAFCAAPVTVAKRHLQRNPDAIAYLLINAGNANAGTGAEGIAASEASCAALALQTGIHSHQVLPFSTGVIGEPLPVDRLIAALPGVEAGLSENAWQAAAQGIMTTDTRPKGASREFEIDGQRCTVNGIAKGAGMIHPDMATMLAFMATDADVPVALLQTLLVEAVEASFNSITVDGDTSTNDACLLFASGAGSLNVRHASDPGWALLRDAVCEVATELAQEIIRDAEGATKFVTVCVQGAQDLQEARRAAYTIALSPLVKTALFASDPNWGRILAALGRLWRRGTGPRSRRYRSR